MFKMRALNLLILYIVFGKQKNFRFEFSFIIIIFLGISSSSSSESIVEDVFISLYTNEKPYDPIHLTKNSNLKDYPEVNPSNPWKFFIHGWTTSPSTSPWYETHKDNYFKDGSYNVVYVDWSKPGNQSYIQSVINAKGCGKVFAELILNLAQNNCVELKNIHLISHSLGSQMAAFAAKEIYSVLREKIGRHTAHDPARPLFETPWLLPENLRLSKNDAEFVDVIHTDSGNYGMITAIGHVDFYPNGGKRFQPGCENDDDSKYYQNYVV